MQSVSYIIGIVCFLIVTVDVWRSPATTGKKVVWTIAALIFSLITLVVWLVWGRKNAYGATGARV